MTFVLKALKVNGLQSALAKPLNWKKDQPVSSLTAHEILRLRAGEIFSGSTT